MARPSHQKSTGAECAAECRRRHQAGQRRAARDCRHQRRVRHERHDGRGEERRREGGQVEQSLRARRDGQGGNLKADPLALAAEPGFEIAPHLADDYPGVILFRQRLGGTSTDRIAG